MVHDDTAAGAMKQLAADLESRGYRIKPITAAGPVRIKVSNPAAAVLSETVICHAGAFWWPWRDQIGPSSDVPGVADVIARVLAALD